MVRNDADDDLMRDAVSLVTRLECQYSSRPVPSIVGLNNLGWLFVYLGADPMYRFDDHGRLRRAFVDDRLFRTEGSTLAMMVRERSSDPDTAVARSTLVRRDLSRPELDAFRDRTRRDLAELNEGLVSGLILRQHPENMPNVVDGIQSALRTALNSREFLAPAVVRR